VIFAPTARGFYKFASAVGVSLAPFQRRIARAYFGSERQVVACLPRGQGKSTLGALIALHHVLSVPDASVYIGAASRDQARIIGEVVRRFTQHPAVEPHVTTRHDEVRLGDRHGPAALRIIASDGALAHGWERPTLMIGDEVWAWSDREPTMLGAMTTALIKNSEARLLLISTAPATPESALGRIRKRALALPDVRREGSCIDCSGHGLKWVEWSVGENVEPDVDAAANANPAPWVSRDLLAEQRPRVSEVEWLQFHCNRAHVSSARWLPVGAWQSCRADYEVADDEPLTLGVDVGGARSTTALVGVVADDDGVRVALVEVRTGRAAVLDLVASIRALVEQGRPIAQVVFDPMRFEGEAMRLERDLGLTLVEWPQSEARMTNCSENLHRLVTEGRLRHFGHGTLDAHVGNAVAKPTPRGWRLVKSGDASHIDALISLAMAAQMAENRPRPTQLLGWI
jgi:phage terminase large subunit-like protein